MVVVSIVVSDTTSNDWFNESTGEPRERKMNGNILLDHTSRSWDLEIA